MSKKELLQSPKAQASMKAEWDRLRGLAGMRIKFASGLTSLVKPKRAIANLTSDTYSVSVLRITLNSLLCIRSGSLKGEWSFKEIVSPIKAGRPLSSKT